MPYDERLAERVSACLKRRRGITQKKMFGGLCYLVNGNMCCGVEKDRLVVRVGQDQYEDALRRKHVKPMDFTDRPLKGFVYVTASGLKRSDTLKKWVDLGVEFAKSLPKK